MEDYCALFSATYTQARERFRRAVRSLGWEGETYDTGIRGPDGDALTVDVGISPGDGSAGTVVVTSGLHGIEGFFGSAAQLALLQGDRGPEIFHGQTRCVVLHAFYHYGFANLRLTY